MGFLSALFNVGNAQGVREMTLTSYKQGLQKFSVGDNAFSITAPHWYALYHVQKIIYGDPGQDVKRSFLIFSELAPFLMLGQEAGLNAFVEYRVFRSGKPGCDIGGLRYTLSNVVSVAANGVADELLKMAFIYCCECHPPAWYTELLQRDTQDKLYRQFKLDNHYEPGDIPQIFW